MGVGMRSNGTEVLYVLTESRIQELKPSLYSRLLHPPHNQPPPPTMLDCRPRMATGVVGT